MLERRALVLVEMLWAHGFTLRRAAKRSRAGAEAVRSSWRVAEQGLRSIVELAGRRPSSQTQHPRPAPVATARQRQARAQILEQARALSGLDALHRQVE